MKKRSITVTEASRNFAECVNRAHYQNVTFVLLKNGEPVARLIPDGERVCLGRDLVEALAKADLPENEARAWHRDLKTARKTLRAPLALVNSRAFLSFLSFLCSSIDIRPTRRNASRIPPRAENL
jgi:antitoxin (DNA-binding transcriptional repressor) of toxin-antitoxin stability system